MPVELFKRIDLDLLMPDFRDRWLELVARCASRGAIYCALSGWRTQGEQMFEWSKGRTTPGPHAGEAGYGPLGQTVTKAKAWESAHNFGIAGDCVRVVNGIRRWEVPFYNELAEEAPHVGLMTGARWQDFDHVQVPGFVTCDDLAPLTAIMKNGGNIQDCWNIVLSRWQPAPVCA